jgi:hypothetical protein
MFHASAVPDFAEPRKRTLLVAGVTGAGPVAIIVIPPKSFRPNLSGQDFAGQDVAGNGFAAMPQLQICSQQPSRQFYKTR